MPVTEVELECVTAHCAPAFDGDAGKLLLISAADLIAQQIALSGVLSAGGPGTKTLHGNVMLHAILPTQGDEITNGLYPLQTVHALSDADPLMMPHGRLDEAKENGMRVIGLGKELGMELAGDEERMVADFHHFRELAIR